MKDVYEQICFNSYPQDEGLFRDLSGRTLGNLDHLPQRLLEQPNKKMRILSLGCGLGVEFSALKIFFNKHQIDIEYIGVDNNSQLIGKAQAIHKNFNKKEVRFYCLDASDPSQFKEFIDDNSIDLIVLQHPYLLDTQSEIQAAFIKIITRTIPAYLTAAGCLYASFYHQEELMLFGNLNINNNAVFRGRQDKIIEFTNDTGWIETNKGQQFIPERFTWISQAPLNFSAVSKSSKTNSQGTSCYCWAGLFAVSAAVAVTAYATNYYTNMP